MPVNTVALHWTKTSVADWRYMYDVMNTWLNILGVGVRDIPLDENMVVAQSLQYFGSKRKELL